MMVTVSLLIVFLSVSNCTKLITGAGVLVAHCDSVSLCTVQYTSKAVFELERVETMSGRVCVCV